MKIRKVLHPRNWVLPALVIYIGLATNSVATFAQEKIYTRAPYLALGTPTSMTIVWRTEKAIQPAVRIGASPQQLKPAPKTVRTAQSAEEPLSAAWIA